MDNLDCSPKIRASSAKEFLDSLEGSQCIHFLRIYLNFNHMARPLYSRFLAASSKLIRDDKSFRDITNVIDDLGASILLSRFINVSTIVNTFMQTDDLASLCIALRADLEDLPSKAISASDSEIDKFYGSLANLQDSYFSDLWCFPDPSSLPIENYEKQLVDKVQQKNIESTKAIFQEIVKFRSAYRRLFLKYKHRLSIDISYADPIIENEALVDDTDCFNIAVAFDTGRQPFHRPSVFIIGDHAMARTVKISEYCSHFHDVIIRRRINWLRYDCRRMPPTVVYGKNPLTAADWTIYEGMVRSILPEPLFPWPPTGKRRLEMSSDIKNSYQWIHGSMSKVFDSEPTRFFT